MKKFEIPRCFKIVSDGTTRGTHIYDPDGKKLGMVTKMIVEADKEIS